MAEKLNEKPRLELVDTPPESVFDDIEALRKTAAITVTRQPVQVNVMVGKPRNNVYFRCHPDPAMSLGATVVIGDKGSDDCYFVHPSMLQHPAILRRKREVTIAVVSTWPGGAISLWPVPSIENTSVLCWKSARAAYERSKTDWVQIIWNGDKKDYDVTTAEGIHTEPAWPDNLRLEELLRLGFPADRIINTPEHPYVLQLRGLAT
jgi:hypothetical protein